MRAGGYRDLGSLLAELWKTSLPVARQLCLVAQATASRHTLHGEVLPAEFPDLARAVLGDDAASDDPVGDHSHSLTRRRPTQLPTRMVTRGAMAATEVRQQRRGGCRWSRRR